MFLKNLNNAGTRDHIAQAPASGKKQAEFYHADRNEESSTKEETKYWYQFKQQRTGQNKITNDAL